MTEEMIAKARILAKKHVYSNVEFRLGDIEKMPLDDNSVDVIISNCVINLSQTSQRFSMKHTPCLKMAAKCMFPTLYFLAS